MARIVAIMLFLCKSFFQRARTCSRFVKRLFGMSLALILDGL